jgi:hypothetical protein
MKELVVEVMISSTILCGGNCDSSLLFEVVMGIVLEGFALFILAGCLLTFMVTISGYIWLLWGFCVCLELYFGHCVSYRAMVVGCSPGRGLIL